MKDKVRGYEVKVEAVVKKAAKKTLSMLHKFAGVDVKKMQKELRKEIGWKKIDKPQGPVLAGIDLDDPERLVYLQKAWENDLF